MELLEEWQEALKEAQTTEQKQHVKLSMLQMLSLASKYPEFGFDFKEEIIDTLKENDLFEPYKKYYV